MFELRGKVLQDNKISMLNLSKRYIFLDRDGVINFDSPHYIRSPEEWSPIPGSLEAIHDLKKAGFRIIIITNQSGIGRGYYSESTLGDIHQKMHKALSVYNVELDGIFYCPHTPDENCECRKPKAGLLLQAAQKLQINLRGVPFIGDKETDVDAAIAGGAFPIRLGKPDVTTKAPFIFESLQEAVRALLHLARHDER